MFLCFYSTLYDMAVESGGYFEQSFHILSSFSLFSFLPIRSVGGSVAHTSARSGLISTGSDV